jgi:hypothetical protein
VNANKKSFNDLRPPFNGVNRTVSCHFVTRKGRETRECKDAPASFETEQPLRPIQHRANRILQRGRPRMFRLNRLILPLKRAKEKPEIVVNRLFLLELRLTVNALF